jgi:NhaP-type Na+/H+ or K+/H+ antiporter
METQATGHSRQQTSYEFYKKLSKLTIGGGIVFWATTIAISLLPIAAEYRAAESISNIQTVWIGGLLVGMIIGCCVSYSLLRFFDKIPTKNPILKSVILSFFALIIVTILIEVPANFLTTTSDALLYFIIGAIFNVLRILALGIVIGYLYKRLYWSARVHVVGIGLSGFSQFKGDTK